MASKSHTEFEYRHQVMGETIWEKIKILRGFLEGRVRAAKMEEVDRKKYQAKIAKLEYLKRMNSEPHVVLEHEADILEAEAFHAESEQLWKLNREEIAMLERLLAEAYVIAELTRIEGYSDEQMFEVNAANEFTAVVAKHLQAGIIANGFPNPIHVEQAMSNPVTWAACMQAGLIPAGNSLLLPNNNPTKIVLVLEEPPVAPLNSHIQQHIEGRTR